ncbi:DNA primase [Mycoplasma zalophi]|uniref:DNA primase n=1 Tax=Mycoplasma zalophi TaxID=191287 RepID=A0ABS6DRR6_9MOLU|nr:DNA primase [Mycoplasma zalophi]MBU4692456.1 DNA primase [Mycoplasma zalophi]
MTDNNQNIWKSVLNQVNIVDIISEYCNLTKSGKNYKTNCPFHNEKTSSFIVSPEKQIFTCFGCHKTGNAIKFLEYRLNLTPIEALKKIATKINFDISKLNRFSPNTTQEQTELFEATEAANNLFQYEFHKFKNQNNDLQNVILKRKITAEIQNHFKLGFSSNEINSFQYLQDKGFDEAVLSKISISSSNNKDINFFNNRLIFPIYDSKLNCVGFSARTVDGDDVKYLNTSENEIFKKNSLFFNWNNVKESIAINREIYLVEGQFDVVALYRIGINNALAVMGTTLTENHLSLLKKCTINLFFDGDLPGTNATIKNLKIILNNLKKYELNVKIIQNNTKNDPDEIYFLSSDGSTLKETATKKIGYLDYIYNLIFENPNYDQSLEQKQLLLREFNEFWKILSQYDQEILKQKAILQNKLDSDYFKNLQSFSMKNYRNNIFENNTYKNSAYAQHTKKFNRVLVTKDTPRSDFYKLANHVAIQILKNITYWYNMREVIRNSNSKWKKMILNFDDTKINKKSRITTIKQAKTNSDKFTNDLKIFIRLLDPNEIIDENDLQNNLFKFKNFYSNLDENNEENIKINQADDEQLSFDRLIKIIEKTQE